MQTLRSAKTLGALSGWSISNLAAQKLLYLSHLTHIGEGREGSVVSSSPEFEAWDYGPVSPELYHKVKAYGEKPYPDIFGVPVFSEGDAEYESLFYVYNQLKDARPGQLVNVTHWSKGAWAKNYLPGIKGVKISDRDILDEYAEWAKAEAV